MFSGIDKTCNLAESMTMSGLFRSSSQISVRNSCLPDGMKLILSLFLYKRIQGFKIEHFTGTGGRFTLSNNKKAGSNARYSQTRSSNEINKIKLKTDT